MQGIADQQYLKSEQYANAGNLSARVQLHARFSTNHSGWMPWIFDHFELASECTILELGCGPGTLWKSNRYRLPSGWNITLSDFSPGMIAEAKQALQEVPHEFNFEVVDAQAIPFPEDTFDSVIANHMLYHVPDLPKALAEIARVLKPGGRFYATTIGRGHLRELLEIVARFVPEWVSPPKSFLLDTGADVLRHYFSEVRCDRYEDALIVTDPQILFEYICSLGTVGDVLKDVLADLKEFLQEQIRTQGKIYIHKDSGIFIARNLKK